ncbi:thioredoxin domain-containing protein [Tetragenococcus halophilus]|uniref:DsbA family protein n=1 Tax=Tetragenococcus halophilus TaxID=51669 RepID=A0A3G5FJ16_TETHA|nr:thioredoxin domain-containing protein [Tetragenococcus halophilus]AOF48747.1 thioredoxin [Tetragenococcus halophilus]AYW50346.1 DsbA family protein [Tetragenococcus halophilus]MCF1600772.1 DsbA family protein [Tetragenococcus halophilus]MCF1684539.1 DsbA family protein [Tetragenococcus halophilus]MCO7025523.1 DsbA family protein [Tetragenococcus halophilus]
MDISAINKEEVNTDYGILIGKKAPKTTVEFINLNCPFCKQWFTESKDTLNKAVTDGKLNRVVKLLDRTKESLQRGNVMHRFVTDDDSDQALEDMTRIFASQDEWGNLPLQEVANYARNELGLSEHHHLDIAEEIVQESKKANISSVPTLILGEHIFDENIDQKTLNDYISE